MTARPLELSYNWQTPVAISTIGLILCLSFLIKSHATGWLGAVLGLLLLWAAFMIVVWVRTRALIEVDGDQLRVRRFRTIQVLQPNTVASVQEYLTGSGPSYKVHLVDDPKICYVPSAMLRKGHSTFFNWLLTYSPAAELDKGSRKTIDRLRTRGLIE